MNFISVCTDNEKYDDNNILEGTSVLKEMVQNADDAGATEMAFCLDFRTHNKEELAFSKLADFQGPAMMVYNNAQFTDVDFQSIQVRLFLVCWATHSINTIYIKN